MNLIIYYISAVMNPIINRFVYTETCGIYATCECCLLSKRKQTSQCI